jgi:hypothetical protein
MGKWSTSNIQVADKTKKNPLILAHLLHYTVFYLNSPVLNVRNFCFNISGLRIFPARFIYMLCVIVTINTEYFAIPSQLLNLYNDCVFILL